MSCACRNKKKFKYIWTSDDGQTVMEYSDRIVAKAKVSRAGGSYQTIQVT